MTGGRPGGLAAAGLALALACAGTRQPEAPTLLAVNPARGPGTAAVEIEISGRNLDAHVRTDFSSAGGREGLDAGFAARLEPASGAAVALPDVRLTQRRTLVATVPAGVAPGTYRLVVTDPLGRSGALERGYRVLSSPDAVARFDVTVLGAARAGVGFPVSIVALDAGGAVVDGFEGAVTVSDTAGGLAPVSAGPFVLGRCAATVAIPGVVRGDALVVTDGAGHAGTSAPFDVTAGPPMALVFAAPPVVAGPGACSPRVDVALRDGLGAPAAAEGDVVAELESSPPGVPFFADAACATGATSVTVAAGAGGAGFHFRAAAPGVVTIRASPAALPSATQVETVTP